MSHVPHDLHDEFPDAGEALHALKTDNAHFAKLAGEYHVINRQIHRIESDVEPASDERAEELKKKRLALLDEISGLLSAQMAKV